MGRVKIFVFPDKHFNFFIKTPSINFLIKNILKTNEFITLNDIYKIAKIKKLDMEYLDIKIIVKNILNFIKLYKIKIKNFLTQFKKHEKELLIIGHIHYLSMFEVVKL